VIEDCLFVLNDATLGGAIYSVSGTVVGCTFERNHADYGGALHLWFREPNVTECTFIGNSAGEGSVAWLRNAGGTISQCILAFGGGGGTIEDYGTEWDPSSSTIVTQCVVFENAGGDDVCCNDYDNVVADPLLCSVYTGDYSLCENSPGLPGNNDWDVQVGAHGQGCGPCDSPVEATSWGTIKAMFR